MIGKIGEKDISGKSMWVDLSKWEEDVKILVSHIKAQQKLISTDE